MKNWDTQKLINKILDVLWTLYWWFDSKNNKFYRWLINEEKQRPMSD